jgi:hypothetical protein
MTDIIELRETITDQMDEGVSLDRVDTEIIAPQDQLGDEEKAALWLFAWSLEPLARWRSRAPQLSGRMLGGCCVGDNPAVQA